MAIVGDIYTLLALYSVIVALLSRFLDISFCYYLRVHKLLADKLEGQAEREFETACYLLFSLLLEPEKTHGDDDIR